MKHHRPQKDHINPRAPLRGYSSICRPSSFRPWSWRFRGTPSIGSCAACLRVCQSLFPALPNRLLRRDSGRRTLLPAGLLDLARHAVSHQPVVGLELLHRLGGVVEESKAGALATTEVCPETEDGDILLLGLVQLSELAAELVLGDVGAVGVEDVAGVGCQKQCPFLRDLYPLYPALTRPFGDDRGGGCG